MKRRRIRYVARAVPIPALTVRAFAHVPGAPWALPVETLEDGERIVKAWGGTVVPAGKDEPGVST